MDLFEDLPEPGRKLEPSSVRQGEKRKWENSSSTIFSDLPPPVSENESKGSKRKLEEDSVLPVKKTQVVYDLQGFSAERKGEREEMQDYHLVIDDFKKDIPNLHSSVSRLSFYAVFDGHGGARASRFAATHLHQNLASALLKVDPAQVEKDIKRAMLEAFKKTDEEFLKEAKGSKPSWKDGTTAIVVLVWNDVLYIANLGDSKAILCRSSKDSEKLCALPLSKDHNPTDYMERMRIQKAGGYVRDGRVMGILEVSRSIGDGQYKMLGVTCVPDVKRCQLTADDKFILLACDGLWKVFTSEEVIQVVHGSVKKKMKTVESPGEICFETACNRLVSESIRKQSGDNVTVVVIAVKRLLE